MQKTANSYATSQTATAMPPRIQRSSGGAQALHACYTSRAWRKGRRRVRQAQTETQQLRRRTGPARSCPSGVVGAEAAMDPWRHTRTEEEEEVW